MYLYLQGSFTSIPQKTFSGCKNLNQLNGFLSSVLYIGDYAFEGSGIGYLYLNENIINIGDFSFINCPNLYLDIDTSNPHFITEDGVLYNKDKTQLIAFSGSLQTEYFLPSTIVSIKNGAFLGADGLTGFQTDNSKYTVKDGVLFKNDTLVAYPPGKLESNYNFNFSEFYYNCLRFIGDYAFAGCKNLVTINIPNAYSIGDHAFYQCINWTGSFTLPTFCQLGNSALEGCKNLTNINIGETYNSNWNSTFANCSNLSKITLTTSNPPFINSTTFLNIDKTTCKLDVPANSKQLYSSTEYWRDFFNFTTNLKLVNNHLKVYTTQSEIIIEGTSKDEIITLYTLNGKQLQTIKSQGEKIAIPAATNAVYLVKTAGKTFKVML
jgi:hypothetical protein